MTQSQSVLDGLVERLGKAQGPDRQLDRDIGLAIGGWRLEEYATPNPTIFIVTEDCAFPDHPGSMYPALTEIVDEALALVERKLPGWKRSIFEKRGGGWIARISSPRWDTFVSGEDNPRPNAAIALLLATLSALKSLEDL